LDKIVPETKIGGGGRTKEREKDKYEHPTARSEQRLTCVCVCVCVCRVLRVTARMDYPFAKIISKYDAIAKEKCPL